MADKTKCIYDQKAGEGFAVMDTARIKEGNPYLSIVIPSRNDNYGGDLLRRMELSLRGLFEQLEKYRLESELILVDWNPPAEMPLLKDVLKWPCGLSYCSVRVIVVSHSIHQRYKGSDRIPINIVAATNCGIRRSRGQFILPRPIDLLYSDELISYIASRKLEEGQRYRVDRCDVERNVVNQETISAQLDYCSKNIIITHSKTPQPKVTRWRNWLKGPVLPNLHTMAAGDFQLMSRYYWHLLRGYPETDISGSYSDGLISYASYAAGAQEIILDSPIRVFHIDHDYKFAEKIKRQALPFENRLFIPLLPEWFNRKIIGLYQRLLMLFGYKMKSTVRGVATLDFSEYYKMCREIISGKRSYIFNDENWGLGNEPLEEFIISTADWDKEHKT
ncbi:hypothetical protein D4R78_01840 [bacterium]|nr:MAG: hypothetical protein D4R78_01840 [bacterium]